MRLKIFLKHFAFFSREMRQQKLKPFLMGCFWGGQKWPQPANKKLKTNMYKKVYISYIHIDTQG